MMNTNILSRKLQDFSLRAAFIPFALLLLIAPWAQLALAEDNESALPPPAKIQDTPEARETVSPVQPDSGDLSNAFSDSESANDGDIYSYKREDGTKVEEYSHRGHVYMVKVSPPGGLPPYYLYDRNGSGNFQRDSHLGGRRITPPEWVIKHF